MQTHSPVALDELIKQSLAQHIDMVALLRELQRLLNNQSYSELLELNRSLSTLQDLTRQTDRLLLEELAAGELPDELAPLLQQRTSLQQEIMQLLATILPGARNVKSLLAREMQTLKTGHNALIGYKSQAAQQSRIINYSS